nr:transcription factor HES-4-like [Cherax quadricarinatus]
MDSGTTSSVLEGALASRNDTRKSNKPLMEKKRRQRINRCLNELKLLVLEALRKDPSRYNKLEKADILEMTVRYVQALHQEGGRSVGGGRLMGGVRPIGGDEKAKYRAGFVQCAVEVRRYLAGISGVPEDLHSKVISHLNSVSSGVTGGQGVPGCPSLMVGGGVVTVAPPIPAHMPTTAPLVVTTTTDSTTGGHRQDGSFAMSFKNPQTSMFPESPKSVTIGGGITLVPARLASGQVALVVPPGTALPIEASNTRSSTPLTDSNNLVNNESLRNITPFIPFRSSRKADAGTGAGVLSSTNVFPKDTFVASSHSLSASGLPASHYTSQIITLSHPKILPRSLDVATVTSSSQVLSTRKITVVPGKSSVHLPDAMTVALPDSLMVSKENWGTHITSVPTHTTSVPTHATSVPTHTTYAPVHTTNTTTHTSNPIAHTTNTTTHTTSSKACTTSTTTHTPNTTSYITSPTTHTTSTTTHTPNTTSYITSPTTHTQHHITHH